MSEPQRADRAHLHAEQVDGLVAAAGVDGAREILEAFWRSTLQLLGNLSNELRDNAHDLAAATAHALKGSAANVGAQRLADTASHLEEACKKGDGEKAAGILERAHEDFQTFKTCFDDHISKS